MRTIDAKRAYLLDLNLLGGHGDYQVMVKIEGDANRGLLLSLSATSPFSPYSPAETEANARKVRLRAGECGLECWRARAWRGFQRTKVFVF